MFYLAGPDMQAQQLLELLMQHSVGLVCQTVEAQPQRRALALDGLRQEGFAAEQALLPNDLRNFEGYRLLQEYFAFPARFQFFSVNGLRPLLQSVREGKKRCASSRSWCCWIGTTPRWNGWSTLPIWRCTVRR